MSAVPTVASSEPRAAPPDHPSFVISVLRWALVVALMIPMLSAVCVLGPFTPRAARRLLSRWCRWVLLVFGIEVDVEQIGPLSVHHGPRVYVQLNQGSLLDGVIWTVAVPDTRGVINVEYALLPFVGWASAAAGAIVVVRQWAKQAHRAIAKAEALVRAGEGVAISIEGRRSVDGSLMPYKKGPAVLAIRTGATIIPVLYGASARDCLRYGEWRVRPTRVRVTYGEPISTGGLTLDDRDALVARLREVADALRVRERSGDREPSR